MPGQIFGVLVHLHKKKKSIHIVIRCTLVYHGKIQNFGTNINPQFIYYIWEEYWSHRHNIKCKYISDMCTFKQYNKNVMFLVLLVFVLGPISGYIFISILYLFIYMKYFMFIAIMCILDLSHTIIAGTPTTLHVQLHVWNFYIRLGLYAVYMGVSGVNSTETSCPSES